MTRKANAGKTGTGAGAPKARSSQAMRTPTTRPLAMPTPAIPSPLLDAQLAWLAHPQELAERLTALSADLVRLQMHASRRMLGVAGPDPIAPNVQDERFLDKPWSEAPVWDLVKEWYLAFTRHYEDMLYATPDLSERDRRRAAFWLRQWLNAVAPTNFLWTNPVALAKAVESGGDSLVRGFRNFLDDALAGNVRMTNPDDFKVGVNVATTPGAVVYRNRLIEVIHYAPTCPQVHAEPVVIVTPWINKYYVLDLTPKKSLVKYLVDQGFDVFITSWKNPDAGMAEVRFDDYLTEGVDAIMQVARDFAGAKKVHAVGYCIGGTALAMYMAWANRHYDAEAMPVADWTLFNTLVDFSAPGDIEVFIDEDSVQQLCQTMAQKGYLDGKEMASSFRMLRSNSLIWHYIVHGWLYGEPLPPSDVLFWNMDTTRMPMAMHSWYLTELYLHNRLVEPDALTVAGEALDLTTITQPLYVVAAEDDHITPWQQTFRTINLVRGETRFVLSNSGHILAIVNPPVEPPRRRFRAATARWTDEPLAWRERFEQQPGTWWGDWIAWLGPRAGPRVAARPVETKAFPALVAAPGAYALER